MSVSTQTKLVFRFVFSVDEKKKRLGGFSLGKRPSLGFDDVCFDVWEEEEEVGTAQFFLSQRLSKVNLRKDFR